MFDKLRVENQLAILRNKWLKEPKNRSIIERQAKCLKLALEETKEDIYETAQQIFTKE